MQVSLQCTCGNVLLANQGMAGTRIPCTCGRVMPVPSLGEMGAFASQEKSSHSPDDAATETPAIPRNLVAWFLVSVFLSNSILMLLFSPLGGWLCFIGAAFIIVGQVWLFWHIYEEDALLAAYVLCLPIVGPLIAVRYIAAHQSATLWPLICTISGLGLAIVGAAGVR